MLAVMASASDPAAYPDTIPAPIAAQRMKRPSRIRMNDPLVVDASARFTGAKNWRYSHRVSPRHRLSSPTLPHLKHLRTGSPIATGICMRPQPAGRGGVPNESRRNRTLPRRAAGGSWRAATISAALHGAAVLSLLFLFHADRVLPRPKPDGLRYIPLVRTPPRWLRD